MVIAVHNVSKPALGRRALWATLLMLLMTVTLAYQMVQTRSRISPSRWGISFAVPQGFARRTPARPSPFIPFIGSSDSGSRVSLIVWQLGDLGESDPAKIPDLIFQQFESSSQRSADSGKQSLPIRKKLGPIDGAEQISSHGTTLVRSAIFNNREVYAISLSVETDDRIDQRLYDIFDRMCLSVQPR